MAPSLGPEEQRGCGAICEGVSGRSGFASSLAHDAMAHDSDGVINDEHGGDER